MSRRNNHKCYTLILTSVENISPETTHGIGPKPREKAEMYKAMRGNGNHSIIDEST